MTNEQISLVIAQELGVRQEQVARTIALLDEENTLPFIARYRKEVTGGLDEEQIRTIQTRLAYLRNLSERKETVLGSIQEQGKLTPDLQAQIEAATTLQQVEDLYLPYRPKRRTRATIARERGLQPLADRILAQAREKVSPEQAAAAFMTDDVPSVADALQGARDIVAETVAEQAEIRAAARAMTEQSGMLVSTLADAAKDPQKTYQIYYDYRESLQRIPPHRLLAINRGEQAGALSVRIDLPAEPVLAGIEHRAGVNERSPWAGELRMAIAEGYKRLLAPAVERDVRGSKTDSSEAHAITIFGTNLRNLLLQPPLRGKCVLGIDPGIRTGCKLALVDQTGKYLGGTTIYPHEPKRDWNGAKQTIKTLIERGQVNVIAIGNGTASRETEQLVAEAVRETGGKIAYAIVSEAGASVYSASTLARAELPDLDVAMRGAVSIARRLQDPLAELVKIDPKSIGVGLYQHDVD